ncbi:MAG: hypothetical protein ABGZ17_07305, partial [Planctomycetaceae bacterium]
VALGVLISGALAISSWFSDRETPVAQTMPDNPQQQPENHNGPSTTEPSPVADFNGGPGQQPMIVVRSPDSADRHYSDLDDAIREAPDRSEIRIHNRGPHLISPIKIKQSELTLRAICSDYVIVKPKQPNTAEPLISVVNARLQLDGISIERDAPPPSNGSVRNNSLLLCIQGQLIAKHCRFRTNSSIALVMHHPQLCDLASCEIYTIDGIAIQWSYQRGSRLAINNCVVLADTAIQQHFRPDFADIILDMRENTIIAWYLMQLRPNSPLAGSRQNNPGPPPGVKSQNQFTSLGTRNVFDVGHTVLNIRHADIRKKNSRIFRIDELNLKSLFKMTWTDNLYSSEAEKNRFISISMPVSGRAGVIAFSDPIGPGWAPSTLIEWSQFWGCDPRDSAIRSPAYSNGRNAVAIENFARRTPTQLGPAMFRLEMDGHAETYRYGAHSDRVGRVLRPPPNSGGLPPIPQSNPAPRGRTQPFIERSREQ